MLFELPRDGGVRVYVRVDEVQTLASALDGRAEREPGPPRALVPRQLDALDASERQAAQDRYACVARVRLGYVLFKVQIPLFGFRLLAARAWGRGAGVTHPKL